MSMQIVPGVVSSICDDYFVVMTANEAFLVPIFDGGLGFEASAPEEVEFFDPQSISIGDEVDVVPISPYFTVGFRRAAFV